MIFIALEVVGSHYAHSIANLTDAAYLFSDLIGFFIYLLSLKIEEKSTSKIGSSG